MKKSKQTSWNLNRRLFLSLSFGVFSIVLFTLFFKSTQEGPKIDGAPVILRHSFVWNEQFWSKIASPKKLSVPKPNPPKGELPRVNGELGLEEVAELKNYKVTIINGDKKLLLPVSAFHTTEKFGYSTDFRCIEGWSEVMQFAGMRFSDFMKFYDLGKKTDGSYYNYVGLETPDKIYYVSIDMESMLHPQTVLAYEMNEAPLEDENGAPLRLAIPIKYGIKSLKRIGKITFSDTRPPDYWAERGYDWYSGL
ncbi:MAG: molybdopterin-dependent oxidoreductase [Bacteriovorax sp.]